MIATGSTAPSASTVSGCTGIGGILDERTG